MLTHLCFLWSLGCQVCLCALILRHSSLSLFPVAHDPQIFCPTGFCSVQLLVCWPFDSSQSKPEELRAKNSYSLCNWVTLTLSFTVVVQLSLENSKRKNVTPAAHFYSFAPLWTVFSAVANPGAVSERFQHGMCVLFFFLLSLSFRWVSANSAMHIMNSQKSQLLAHRGH